MTVRDLKRVMNAGIKLDFQDRMSNEILNNLSRKEKLLLLDRPVYMIYPTEEPNHLLVTLF